MTGTHCKGCAPVGTLTSQYETSTAGESSGRLLRQWSSIRRCRCPQAMHTETFDSDLCVFGPRPYAFIDAIWRDCSRRSAYRLKQRCIWFRAVPCRFEVSVHGRSTAGLGFGWLTDVAARGGRHCVDARGFDNCMTTRDVSPPRGPSCTRADPVRSQVFAVPLSTAARQIMIRSRSSAVDRVVYRPPLADMRAT